MIDRQTLSATTTVGLRERSYPEQHNRSSGPSSVAAIEAPTMLIYADGDAIRLESVIAMYRRLGGAQGDAGLAGSVRSAARLAIVPGATHYDILSTTAVAELAAPFLDMPLPRAR